MASAPNSITCTIIPCGGIVNIALVSSDTGTWTLTRSYGADTFVLYNGPPLSFPDNVPFYLDIGDGLNGPLDPTTVYTYSFFTTSSAAVSQTVTPVCSIVLEYDDYLELLVNVISAGVQSLRLSGPSALWHKPSVRISMPLVSQPTIPAISINEDLLQMEEVPIGHGINTDTYRNEYQIQEIVSRRYSVTVLVSTVQEREFWKLAVIALFKSILIPVLINMGQDVRSSFQAASSQVTETMPGFYFCTIMLEFSGILPVKITTSYPPNAAFSIIINGPELEDILAQFGVFIDNGGALALSDLLLYPSSDAGLPPGGIWSNSLFVFIKPGATPDPSAPLIYFGDISPAGLLALGGANIPLTNPGVGTLAFWNNGGLVCVA